MCCARVQGGGMFIATQVASWTLCAAVVLGLAAIGASVWTSLSAGHVCLVGAGTVLAPLSLCASAALFRTPYAAPTASTAAPRSTKARQSPWARVCKRCVSGASGLPSHGAPRS